MLSRWQCNNGINIIKEKNKRKEEKCLITAPITLAALTPDYKALTN
jgi:hypothetical protein